MDWLTNALQESWTNGLLVKAITLTLFYATLCYIPLRGATVLVARIRARRERIRREALLRSIHAMR